MRCEGARRVSTAGVTPGAMKFPNPVSPVVVDPRSIPVRVGLGSVKATSGEVPGAQAKLLWRLGLAMVWRSGESTAEQSALHGGAR